MTFSGGLPRKKAPGTWNYNFLLALTEQALFLSLFAAWDWRIWVFDTNP